MQSISNMFNKKQQCRMIDNTQGAYCLLQYVIYN